MHNLIYKLELVLLSSWSLHAAASLPLGTLYYCKYFIEHYTALTAPVSCSLGYVTVYGDLGLLFRLFLGSATATSTPWSITPSTDESFFFGMQSNSEPGVRCGDTFLKLYKDDKGHECAICQVPKATPNGTCGAKKSKYIIRRCDVGGAK